MAETITKNELLAALPPEPDEMRLFPEIQRAVADSKRKLVVIDDDPTGTQTVHDVELLLTWNRDLLARELAQNATLFYILTNSRSMPEEEATGLNFALAEQLVAASQRTHVDIVIASRSDSTLRGHYPGEILALARGLTSEGQPFDGHLIIPAFFEGGRYTIGDTHYVATPTADSDALLPAHETPFARDSVFGYTTAYLPAWIEEKSKGRWKADQVVSIGLEQIRKGGPDAVATLLQAVEGNRPVVVNAAGYGDLAVVVLGLLKAEAAGKRFLYRTAASFVRLRGAVTEKPLLDAGAITCDAAAEVGGLVVVGSYVPGSSAQLERLLAHPAVQGIELPVERVITDEATANAISQQLGQQLDTIIQAGRVGVLYTSRKLAQGADHKENLAIGNRVSQALVTALHTVRTRPRFIIAKGGITSHDVAQKGLGATRARVLGQLFPGVPVWQLESGAQSHFPAIPYIVFPGNVGGPDSLAQAVDILNDRPH